MNTQLIAPVSFAASMVKQHGIDPTVIRKKKKRCEVLINGRDRMDTAKESIISDYDNGLSVKDIGEKHGVTTKVVYAALKRWDHKRTNHITSLMLHRRIQTDTVRGLSLIHI